MNIHIISLLNDMAEQTIHNFSRLPFVKSAIYSDNTALIAVHFKQLADFYIDFFQKLKFLPLNRTFYKRSLIGTYDFYNELKDKDTMLKEVLDGFPLEELLEMKSITPIHIRYTDTTNFYFVSGLSWIESKKKVLLDLHEFSLSKDIVTMTPQPPHYLMDMLEDFSSTEDMSLRDMVTIKGYSYKQFQKDCKIYWGDTFYSFFSKLKMMEATNDIIFFIE